MVLDNGLAEGVGFEPTIRLPVYTRSRRAPSATRPPLRKAHARRYRGRDYTDPSTAFKPLRERPIEPHDHFAAIDV